MSEDFSSGLVARGLSRVRALMSSTSWLGESAEKNMQRLHQQLQECAEGLGGEVSTRQRAARLANSYLQLDDEGRRAFLRMIAYEFGPDPQAVSKAHDHWQAAVGSPQQWEAEGLLRAALRSQRLAILTQFNAIDQGVKFLVDLRADLLRFAADEPELRGLARELRHRLSAWFDVGFLELQRLTWHSPADVLEKLVAYEAVHEIQSWHDLKNRLDSDRRCYAFFHPRMPLEPLIFVEVALVDQLADNVQRLLDIHAPLHDASQASCAIFYSISSTQEGLRGVSFGNFLLKRVVDDLKRDFPRLKTFATLSPMPTLSRWVQANAETVREVFTAHGFRHLAEYEIADADAPLLAAILSGENTAWLDDEGLREALREPMLRLAAAYLLQAHNERQEPVDPVARFHLGNGACVERVHWLADTSVKGLANSYSLMVNYRYEPEKLEAQLEAYAREGSIAAASAVRKLL